MRARFCFLLNITCLSVVTASAQTHWVATWGASPAAQLATDSEMQAASLVFDNQTLREIVRTSLSSDTVRVRLSNAYGKQAVEIGSAHIALRTKGAAIRDGSDRVLTFGGRTQVSIPKDALVLSDPIKLSFPAQSDLAISIYLPKATTGAGIHYAAQQTSYIGKGDLTSAADVAGATPITSWVFVAGVDVAAPPKTSAIVAFGDSITDGAHSTVDANMRWPSVLSARLPKFGMLDAGIGGNRILHDASSNLRFGTSALARFDRDVLSQAGIGYLIILEGINDLGHAGTSAPLSETVTADDIIAGLKQLIQRAHEKNIEVFCATITPFEGASKGYFTPEKEIARKAVNDWIRSGEGLDGIIDFDKAVRDPEHPDRMLPDYDSGDHLHPGDAGYQAMGRAIDLKLFK